MRTCMHEIRFEITLITAITDVHSVGSYMYMYMYMMCTYQVLVLVGAPTAYLL